MEEMRQDAAGRPGKITGMLFEWAETAVFAVITVVLVFTFLFRVVNVDGDSMEPTLSDGNYVVISGLMYTPKRGDIVVVMPTAQMEIPIIKRVIATEGDEVDIDFEQGIVYVNGTALSEPYTAEATHLRGDMQFPLAVPEGHVFLLGDNRNASLDSRDSRIGLVDERYILGRTMLRLTPFDRFGAVR